MSARAELDAVAAEVEALAGLTLNPLRDVWRQRFEDDPPPIRAADVLRRFLAERIQMVAFGEDLEIKRDIDRLVRSYRPGRPVPPVQQALRPGASLIREWNGAVHRVDVVDGGFVWDGDTYRSLSKVATAITGTRWNGPKFFGLREQEAGR